MVWLGLWLLLDVQITWGSGGAYSTNNLKRDVLTRKYTALERRDFERFKFYSLLLAHSLYHLAKRLKAVTAKRTRVGIYFLKCPTCDSGPLNDMTASSFCYSPVSTVTVS